MKFLYRLLEKRILRDKPLVYKLNVIFGLFFLAPVAGLIYFGIRYNILTDKYLPLFFLGLLIFSFFGLSLLRKVFEEITGISNRMAEKIKQEFPEDQCQIFPHTNEIQRITESVGVIDRKYNQFLLQYERKIREISILKDLTDLCYVTSDPDEILYVALERALVMTDSDVGSIMILERPGRKRFVVRASIGLDKWVRVNDTVDFESSIAKYAVLNKAPLVVADVEKDSRFGRANRPQYGTKSFVCMPIKTSREIIGVLTISRRDSDRTYTNEQIEILEPLLSNAAFTYENLLLMRANRRFRMELRTFVSILEIINSSFRGSELLQACLSEMRNLVPFEVATLLRRDISRMDEIVVTEILAVEPTLVSRGSHLPIKRGSMIARALKQEGALLIPDTGDLQDESDRDLLSDQDGKAAMLVPMRIDGNVGGLLALIAPGTGELESAQQFVQWACRALALAVERNQLYAAVVKRNKELDSIKQIGSALASSTFDIRQVLNYTMEMIRVIMDVEAGSLYLLKDKQLEFAVAFNMDPEAGGRLNLKLGQGIPGYVAARGESIIINDSDGSSLFLPEIRQEAGGKIRSALCVPMISQGKVIGVIEVVNKMNGDFVSNDEDLLQSIASSVSIAIENANLYKETVAMAENERAIRRMFQKFVPKEILDKILHGSASGMEMVEELKTLTLINVDIRGFSKLSKALGPQKTVYLLNAFFSVMGETVFKHHGIVDKYLGDGFLAIFGAPVSSIADADNAISAALEMKKSLEMINATIARELNAKLKIGIAIHTGEVVVGNIGFEMKMDYTVIGDSVNDVFRLQDMTRPYPNSILISEKTLKAARLALDVMELEQRLGRLKIFELIGESKQRDCRKADRSISA